MTLDELAHRYQALEAFDRWEFQRRARVRQSIWREERSYPIGVHRGRNGIRPLGSRLAMPWARETLSNYLTSTIRKVVEREVLDKEKSAGKLYGKPRIFEDLLSSQPMAFNLFAELQQDLPLASSVFQTLSDGRIAEITGIEFEWSPGPGDPKFLEDRSAFDVYATYLTPSGQTGFAGIEVKYHETLIGSAAKHRERYDEVADGMACFPDRPRKALKKQPLQQIWRDHLLAGSLLATKRFDDGFFVFLYPQGNELCDRAIKDYEDCLSNTSSFERWTLENVCAAVVDNTHSNWINVFKDRYLNFGKVAAALVNDA